MWGWVGGKAFVSNQVLSFLALTGTFLASGFLVSAWIPLPDPLGIPFLTSYWIIVYYLNALFNDKDVTQRKEIYNLHVK